jgi:thiamine-monophosphate kinase
MKTTDGETTFIDALARHFTAPPHRLNAIHESDAELIRLSAAGVHGTVQVLAVTTDTVAEEITAGLYADPYQAGWVAAMASLSDLAAVGADPVGIMLAETIPADYPPELLDRLQAGVGDGCASAGTYVLGGDTNFGPTISLTTTAIGLVPDGRPMTRRGVEPGDILYSSGRLGRGNGFALSALGNGPDTPFSGGYFPRARLREGAILRGYASACMDTSDGFFATLDQLGSVNAVGFNVTARWEEAIDPASLSVVHRHGLPPWFLLAGCHGEFELLFTVRPDRQAGLREHAGAAGWNPIEIGVATGARGVRLPAGGRTLRFDTARVRALSWQPGAGIDGIIAAFLEYDRELTKGEY